MRILDDEVKKNITAGSSTRLGLTTFFVMMIPSLIATAIEGGLAISSAVKNSKADTPNSSGYKTGFSAPRPFVRLSPVPSRSSVSYGLPGYVA